MSGTERSYDVVLFGATGFTGGLTAGYLARNAPAWLRWALAGRDRTRLERRRAELTEIDPRCAEVRLLHADVKDVGSLRALAESTRVVITTVGPYIRYGEPLVAACAEAGTNYVDLAGEPEFVDMTYVRYHDQAAATGARIIHSCGFESALLDLGVYLTVQQLPVDEPIQIDGYLHAIAALSGGSLQTTLTALSRMRALARVRRERRRVERFPAGRVVKSTAGAPRRVRRLGAWAMPMPTISRQTIGQSARLLPRYGPNFCYRHRTIKHPIAAAAMIVAFLLLFLVIQVRPLRHVLGRVVKPGQGPSEARRAKCWFRATFIGSGGGQEAFIQITGGDPGYDESAKILAEAALCLASDELPQRFGHVTPAAAMGDSLIARLSAAGIEFRTSIPGSSPEGRSQAPRRQSAAPAASEEKR
ncbi:MAG: saccharopine dehydrogenase NADP-binding domain-containing protein [Kutzneria sp.]|nr:saccharopine dehydrogenase NADP-binding domain-containing protein [Kutzneria sp.]